MSAATELALIERALIMEEMKFNDDYMHLDGTDKQRVVDYIDELIAAAIDHRKPRPSSLDQHSSARLGYSSARPGLGDGRCCVSHAPADRSYQGFDPLGFRLIGRHLRGRQ